MKDWKQCTLGDVADIKHGYAFKGEYFSDTPTDYLLVTPGNFAIGGGFQEKPKYYNGNIPEEYVLQRGDLIVTMTDLSKQGDTLGYSAIVPVSNRYLHNQRIGLVCIKSQCVLKEYVYWVMRTFDYQRYIVGYASGSTVKHTAPKTILGYTFLAPPIDKQRQIAKTLGALDDKIEANNKINHHLEEMAQAIWTAQFGNCEPNGVLGDVIELFDSRRIPLSSNQREKMDKIYPYYGAASLMDYVDDYLFDDIYLLLGEDGTVINDSGFPKLQYVWGKFWVNNHAHIIQGRNGFTVEILYTLLKQTSVTSIVTGAVQPKINQANLKSLEVVIPSAEALEQFNIMIDPLFIQFRVNSDENLRLATLRDTLLPRLMSGELSVTDIGSGK